MQRGDLTVHGIESVLDWASVRGYCAGDNPARWRSHLAKLLPQPGEGAQSRASCRPALRPYDEMPAFVSALRQQTGMAARALCGGEGVLVFASFSFAGLVSKPSRYGTTVMLVTG
jgi:hypothetical protein